ncbi:MULTISPECIES: DUF559 domain-containing protein [unclassified Nocardioides]|uniref:DUF559 domain-containing protein n=1 Tax=unclassified Nocardioides TaxID=2615069 RepID=UPI0006FCAC5C|nr:MULTISPECIES: DUF559 domain-containing protein [unclassified Nocardioides]KQY50917.1 hypothetical protein ASD30_20755 [Nocardioides sp. Root140]KRF14660.1 hypothetical protein ASH02_10155 [Nocardioides sp. Soil796]
MDALTALHRCGGSATWAELKGLTNRRGLDKALQLGVIVKHRHGSYALPTDDHRRAAGELCGVVSGLSAALHWGLKMKKEPEHPTVTVPRSRRVDASRREGVQLHRDTLPAGHVFQGVTSLARTVADCARWLPFDEAVCVADSALRSRLVTKEDLRAVVVSLPRTGRSRAMAVVEFADGRAANPFESCLRVIAAQVTGLCAEPQVEIGPHRVDLADRRLRLVIEAESYAFHGSKELFRADVRRYTWLATQQWVVARFLWEDVMHAPERVREALHLLVKTRLACSCLAATGGAPFI